MTAASLSTREFQSPVTSHTPYTASGAGMPRLVRLGLGSVIVLILGLGGLISFLPMAGAVISPGEITVESHVKEISHAFGGVAAEILVDDGDIVRRGQSLIRLDSRVSGATARYSRLSVDQLLAKAARLRALQSRMKYVTFPDDLTEKGEHDPAVRAVMADEQRSFRLISDARGDQIRQLRARIAQSQAEIVSFDSQAEAYQRQSSLVRQELKQTRELYDSRLTTLDRLNALERSALGVKAQRATALSAIAQAQARISELQSQIL